MRMTHVAIGWLVAMAVLASGCGGDAADEGQGFAPQAPATAPEPTPRPGRDDQGHR